MRIIGIGAVIIVAFACGLPAQARSPYRHIHSVHAFHLHRHIEFRRIANRARRPVPEVRMGASSNIVALAERYVGGNPTGQRSLWCADFANLVLRQAHLSGTGSRLAKSFLSLPRTGAHEGAIAVMERRGGGHVGFVAGFDARGNPIIISGNGRGHKVSVATYDRRRILKYVSPI